MVAELNVWDDTVTACASGRGVYVAVSGNTAAGKSSLILQLERQLRARGLPALGVSERCFHHQYLRLMFSNPLHFAFPIQLSFMLERHLVLLRNLVELRRLLIMERSHFDDILFLEEHYEIGNISQAQRAAYIHVSRVLHEQIPAPDILVLMNPSPEVSLRRLADAELRGERPREFPTEEVKQRWVRRWYDLYVELHERYRQRAANDSAWRRTRLIDIDPSQDTQVSVRLLVAAMEEQRLI